MAGSTDDPVVRIVEAAMEAQTRLMLAYMEQMRQQVTRQTVAAVRAEFGGEQVHIGKRGDAGHKERDAAIRLDAEVKADGAPGLSERALARKWHLSRAQIRRILAVGKTVGRSSLQNGPGLER